jgi:hypothetical protein
MSATNREAVFLETVLLPKPGLNSNPPAGLDQGKAMPWHMRFPLCPGLSVVQRHVDQGKSPELVWRDGPL